MRQIEAIGPVTKPLGSLALAYPYPRRLQVAETIDAPVTAGTERRAATGAVIGTLVLSRLRPRPSSQIGAWARAVGAGYRLPAGARNAARRGRALDELYPHPPEWRASPVLRGARARGGRLDQLPSAVARAAFAPLTLVKQRLRIGDARVDLLTPATLTPMQAQILPRLQLPPPTAYVQPSLTPYPT